jgi:chromosome segregation ATPase
MTRLEELRKEIDREKKEREEREEYKKAKAELKSLKFDRKYGAVVKPIKEGFKKLDKSVSNLKTEQEKSNKGVKRGLGLFR